MKKWRTPPTSTPDTPSPQVAAAEESNLDALERTIFVRGTYSEDKPSYFDPGMMDLTNEHFGSEASEDFDWYRGPLSGVSREVAGRKLLRDHVTPALIRDEKVNLLAHSHGGNVVGEMAGAYGERVEYLTTMLAAIRGDDDADSMARAAIAEQRQRIAEERTYFEESLAGDWAISEPTDQLMDLEEELGQLELEEMRLDAGHHFDFQRELDALQNAEFGDVMNLNTPYLERHDAMTEGPFAQKVERFTDVSHPNDPVVGAAHLHEEMLGGRGVALPDHERLNRVSWTLDEENPLRPVTNGIRRHSEVKNSATAFQTKVLDDLSSTDD